MDCSSTRTVTGNTFFFFFFHQTTLPNRGALSPVYCTQRIEDTAVVEGGFCPENLIEKDRQNLRCSCSSLVMYGTWDNGYEVVIERQLRRSVDDLVEQNT